MRPLLVALALTACTQDPADDPVADQGPVQESPLTGVSETERWTVPGLTHEAYVLRTEGTIPYIYARNRPDLARVQGFVVARDRYFSMDLVRRLSQGKLSELLGEEGLSSDLESRGIGMTHVVDQIVAAMNEDQALGSLADGYAEGVNAYIDAVASGDLPPPSELALVGPFLGSMDPTALMARWTRRDVAAIGATLVYNLGFETTDVGMTADFERLDATYAEDVAFRRLRETGLFEDVWGRVEPVFPISSAPGWGVSDGGAARRAAPPPASARPAAPAAMLDRLRARLDRLERRMGHDHEHGFGSNAWAVAGYASADGRSYLAGDGHLPLTVPSLFYAAGLDTAHLSGSEDGITQVGLLFPGNPILAVGTNGKVAWSQTQLMGDITDWYAEQLELDDDGRPAASLFQGAWQPLVRHDETYVIADVPLLGSVGRTETWSRWTTFDGRWIAEIEGDTARADTVPPAGQALVNVQGDYVIPRDVDGDGVVSAVSFDYTGLDPSTLLGASEAFGTAGDVHAFHAATKRLVAYSQNLTVADASGSILYTGYQAVPCRGYLPRAADGTWVPGADPRFLLDGTRYGGFTIPVVGGVVDEAQGSDPYRCVVPHAEYPTLIDPPEGWVQTANNDPGHISIDGSLTNDPWYIGGPWLEGYRAKRISDLLDQAVAEGWADEAGMARIQGDHYSLLAEQLLPVYLTAIELAKTANPGSASPAGRMATLYKTHAERLDEATARLQAWQRSGLWARSGVETFYAALEPGDEDAAVATMIFNTWMGRFVNSVFEDEGWVGVFRPTGDTGRTRTLSRMLVGRGPDNPMDLASWNPLTQESVFFDVLGTPQVETSDELAVAAMVAALDFLAAPPDANGQAGFGTDDMRQWLWGLKHVVRFESILGEVLSAEDDFGFLIDAFSITSDVLPLGGGGAADLKWFPRHGDHLNVDAGNPGFDAYDFSYGSGPVFRMVIALGDQPSGRNILPGGQSGLNDAEAYADQAALWLGNQTVPMHLSVEEVIASASGRETFAP